MSKSASMNLTKSVIRFPSRTARLFTRKFQTESAEGDSFADSVWNFLVNSLAVLLGNLITLLVGFIGALLLIDSNALILWNIDTFLFLNLVTHRVGNLFLLLLGNILTCIIGVGFTGSRDGNPHFVIAFTFPLKFTVILVLCSTFSFCVGLILCSVLIYTDFIVHCTALLLLYSSTLLSGYIGTLLSEECTAGVFIHCIALLILCFCVLSVPDCCVLCTTRYTSFWSWGPLW